MAALLLSWACENNFYRSVSGGSPKQPAMGISKAETKR